MQLSLQQEFRTIPTEVQSFSRTSDGHPRCCHSSAKQKVKKQPVLFSVGQQYDTLFATGSMSFLSHPRICRPFVPAIAPLLKRRQGSRVSERTHCLRKKKTFIKKLRYMKIQIHITVLYFCTNSIIV